MSLANGPMEIVFAFDPTASMYNCMSGLCDKASKLIQRLQSDIPGIRLAVCIVCIHNGPCVDGECSLVTKYMDFTDDAKKLGDFLENTGHIVDHDPDDIYELGLHQARFRLSWTPGSQRALIMVGDTIPHLPNYPDIEDKFDWRKEASLLGEMGVRTYAVQCMGYTGIDTFYKEIARRTGGHYLQLSDYQNVMHCLIAVCYKEQSLDMLDAFGKEIRARDDVRTKKDLEDVFVELRDGSGNTAVSLTEEIELITAIKARTLKIPPMEKEYVKEREFTPYTAKTIKRTQRMRLCPELKPYAAKNLPRLRRENVPECNFILKNMAWTKWQLAVSPSAKDDSFGKRRGSGNHGFRKALLFRNKTKLLALYEVAVQTKCRTKKYVMYSKCCRIGFVDRVNWERSLLGRPDIRSQVNDIVGKNCSVYVRRVLLKRNVVCADTRQALAIYDYAWRGIPSERKDHRGVTKMSVDISKPMHS